MTAAKRRRRPTDSSTRQEAVPQKGTAPTEAEAEIIQVLAVYHVDLMAEVEGLLRSLTRTQQHVERLRSGGDEGPLSASKRREAVKLLSGNLRTFATKLETMRETLPEILRTAESLEAEVAAEGSEEDESGPGATES